MTIFEKLTEGCIDKLDPMYIKFCPENEHHNESSFWDELYENNKDYLDSNFVSALRQKGAFNQRLWELYLIAFFRNKGFNLVKKVHGPDILIQENGKKVFIECVASTQIPSLESEFEIEGHFSINEYTDPIKLRLTSVLFDKLKKINKYCEGGIINIDNGDVCIIALNSGQSHGWLLSEGLNSILYGLGNQVYGKGLKFCGYTKKDSIAKKKDNDETILINSDLFNCFDYSTISGIIYYEDLMWDLTPLSLDGKSYNTCPETRLSLHLNPNSQNLTNDLLLKISSEINL